MNAEQRWYPIAATHDLVARHVFHGQLLEHELAVWRADDGAINIWSNRCPHRGVRLTLGTNTGEELVCRYHGWHFASGSGACTHVPAHPGTAPSAKLCTTHYPAVERGGLVWTTVDPDHGPGHEPDHEPDVPMLAEDGLVLRALPINVGAASATARLPRLTATAPVTGSAPLTSPAESTDPALWFIQPVDPGRCIARGLLPHGARLGPADRLTTLRTYHHVLSAWRQELEGGR